jgi:hypothetical protein
MRNRKYLIGVVMGVIGAFAFSSVASATVLSQTETSVVSPSKLPKKTYKGATQSNVIATTIDNPLTTKAPQQTVFTFDKNVKFTFGNLPPCPASSVQGKTPAAAAAACPQDVVGQGTVEAASPPSTTLTGQVSLIAGPPNTVYVVTNPGGANLTLPGVYSGRNLTFANLPNTSPIILTKFSTQFNKVKTGKNLFFFMARCSNKKMVVNETTTFYDGVSKTASSTQKCKQTK